MLEAGKYARYELERRFLVERLPGGLDQQDVRVILDRYLIGTRLRLRRIEHPDGEVEHKLGQKEAPSPPDYAVTTITTIYLSGEEYDLLRPLPARELRKRRYRLGEYSIDVFDSDLAGLILAEVTFETEEEMRAHRIPNFAVRDVSEDVRYTGGTLAAEGLPK